MNTLSIVLLIIILIILIVVVCYWYGQQKKKKDPKYVLKKEIDRLELELKRDDLAPEEYVSLRVQLSQAYTAYLKLANDSMSELIEELKKKNLEKLNELNSQILDQK